MEREAAFCIPPHAQVVRLAQKAKDATMTTLDELLTKYRKPLPGGGELMQRTSHGLRPVTRLPTAGQERVVNERNGVRTEHHNYTPAELAEKLDVIFGPGTAPGQDPMTRDTGWVSIDANANGRAAVEAIFPKLYEATGGARFKWKRGAGYDHIWPDAFGADWQSCAPMIPALAAEVPNTLPEHLTKHKPLDLCSEDQLTFIMAIAARNHGARAAWLEMDGPKIKSVNILDATADAPIRLEHERLKREPRTIPLSANYAAKQVRSILAGRKLHLFELSNPLMTEILRMPSEARQTELAGLRDFDLLRLPFGEHEPIAIRFNLGPIADAMFTGINAMTESERRKAYGKTFTAVFGGAIELELENDYAMANIESQMFLEEGGLRVFDVLTSTKDGGPAAGILMSSYLALTILLLAMNDKNIVKRDRLKDAKKKSLRGLTAGPQGVVYLSRTVLEVPEDLPLEPGTHASPRAHRRIGHKHTVLYGPGRSERRVQWFPAVWVNGDPPADWKPTIYEVRQ